LNRAYIQKKLQEHLNGRRNHRQLLWPMVIFESWRQRFAA
jgi:hypothetical protein